MKVPEILVVRRHPVAGTSHLTLTQLLCQRADGATHWWDAVERPQSVRNVAAIFPVTLERTVVLVEQFRPPVETRALELPAGLCDIPGEPFEVAALRELQEETGYTGEILHRTPPSAESSGTIVGRLHLFIAAAMDRGEPKHDPAEAFMAPAIYEFSLDDLPAALLRYHAQYPKNLIDPKILTGCEWWRYFEGGGT